MTRSREIKDYDWAFDLRAFNDDSSDDNSDDGGQNPGSNEKQREERLLLEDFDLGSREESVSYKPNPFSIAKINAAYRSARNGGSEGKSSLSENRPPGKACGLVQTKIDDVLKIQKSNSLKKSVAKKDYRPPGVSYEYSKIRFKPPRPKVGPITDRACVQPQSNTNLEESHIAGFSSSLEPALISGNAHISTLAPPAAPARLNDGHARAICPPSDKQCVKPDSMSFFSPPRSATRLEPRSIFPKLESSPLMPRFVKSNPDKGDRKSSAERQVKQELCQSSEISALGKTEAYLENLYSPLDRASAPLIPTPRNHVEDIKPNLPASMKTGPVFTRAPSTRRTNTKSITPVVPLKRSAGDPYNFSVEDADENWCTLPTRKQRIPKNHSSSSFSVTKSFRLPGLLPSRNKLEPGDTFRKRVVTYLPPPMHYASVDKSAGSRHSHPISHAQDEKRPLALPSPPESAIGCPPPVHISRLSGAISQASQADGLSQPVLPVAPTIRERNHEIYRPPSPPTSDPPSMSSNGAEVRIQVDLRVIRDKSCPRRKGTSYK